MTRKVVEREITAPVDLCLPNGRLNPAAVGWTRTQQHNTDRIGHGFYGSGRNKRWEYWAVTTPTHILALTVSSLDYAAVHEVWVFDRATETPYGHSAASLLSGSVSMPGTLAAGPSRASIGDIAIEGVKERARPRAGSLAVLDALELGRGFMKLWRIHGELADLTFTPFYDKSSSMNLLILSGSAHQCFGHYSGWMRDDTGEQIVDGLLGFAEAVHNRW